MKTSTVTSRNAQWKRIFGFLLLAACAFAGLLGARAQTAEALWAVSAGGTGTHYTRQVAVDSVGNGIVAGQFGASATFGETNLTGTPSQNAFLAKYNSEGALLWVRAITRSQTNLSTSGLVIRPDGNIYLAAQADWNNHNDNDRGLLLSKFNADGGLLWSQFKPNIAFTGGGAHKLMASDATGNLYLAGGVKAPDVAFQGLIVMKLNADGNELWRRVSPAGPQGGSTTDVFARGITADSEGNCAVTGWLTVMPYSSTYVSFGSVVLRSNSKYSTAFTARYDPNGNLLWAKTFVPSYFESLNYANDVATDASGAVYATGNTSPDSFIWPDSRDELFLIKYDKSGNIAWAKRSSGTGENSGNNVSTASNGNVLVLGGNATGAHLLGYDSDGRLTATAGLSYFITVFAPDATGDIYGAGGADTWLVKFSGASFWPPSLQIRRAGNQLLLAWPTSVAGFSLEATDQLGPTSVWSSFGGPPTTIGDENVVMIESGSRPKFFRLKKP